ncbi:MAG: hypothetical protein GXP10_07370 [Gammaproteobacteria bacterium]|nr:hypothetical protein [Gammaproteobacteria bacterium]
MPTLDGYFDYSNGGTMMKKEQSAMRCNHTVSRHQSGYVLVTSLLFLLVLTMVAVVSTQTTTLELRMSANNVAKGRALESSEALRHFAGEVVDAHTFHQGWPVSLGGGIQDKEFGVTFPAGINFVNKTDGVPNNMYLLGSNGAGENPLDPSTLVNDITYQVDGNGDGDLDDGVDISASVSIYRLPATSAKGSNIAMVSGYLGLGRSAAGGGSNIYYLLRSTGTSAGGARAVTASEYRYVP